MRQGPPAWRTALRLCSPLRRFASALLALPVLALPALLLLLAIALFALLLLLLLALLVLLAALLLATVLIVVHRGDPLTRHAGIGRRRENEQAPSMFHK